MQDQQQQQHEQVQPSEKYCELSVAFYNNDRNNPNDRARGTGFVGWYKSSMEYWHTEVAFPPEIFKKTSSSSSSSNSKDLNEKMLFAYGVFSDHNDVLDNCFVDHIANNASRIYFDMNRKYVDIYSVNNKNRTEKSQSGDGGDDSLIDIAMSNVSMSEALPVVQIFEFTGSVSMSWYPRPQVFMNRVNRDNLKKVVVKVNNATSQVCIESPGMVFGKHRSFTNPSYRWLHFTVPLENALEAASFAQSQVGKPHDDYGIYRALLWPKKVDYKSYYCVNFVACVLQRAGMLHGVNPNILLPDDLYKFLIDHPDRTTSVNPYFLYVNSNNNNNFQTPSNTRTKEKTTNITTTGNRRKKIVTKMKSNINSIGPSHNIINKGAGARTSSNTMIFKGTCIKTGL